ncbi:4a-hydroxytetrahydrobiopterin dehydratase [Granulicella sp. WH15]|uniref:4a-hydroxytetrahydrobiopterin dehydratase n=1 Tax=Granulicella sp. WH15 TaxID=2602070 RepID=UPI001367709C|nr:4a-hydroxytetrahydrobiopterin dehydratase [Granulicella sp. WH15]QHN03253.1 4a-hydroxytetrahydrobiopterin dehydratase [Granulicella sp. WH15]
MTSLSALSEQEVKAVLAVEPEWRLGDGKLLREWVFPDFVAAMAFVQRVAELAEAAGHHPDIDIRYNRVGLGLVTHDADGITQRDVEMARKLSAAFPS